MSKESDPVPDLERFDLRRFIAELGDDEVERVAHDVALGDVAALMEGNPRVVVVERPSGEAGRGPWQGGGRRLRPGRRLRHCPQQRQIHGDQT